MAKYVHALTQL